MNKSLGIFLLLVTIAVVTTIINPSFLEPINIENLLRRISLFGIIGIGVAFVIITSGIDLSIGSVTALLGGLLAHLLIRAEWSIAASIATVIGLSMFIGLTHGLLITKLRLQPFVVTLCGLLFYRGISRRILDDQSLGFGNAYDDSLRLLAIGKPFAIPIPFLERAANGFATFKTIKGEQVAIDAISWIAIPMPFLIMIAIAILAAIFLNKTIWGRYIMALGRNEDAARFSGINTDKLIILAYIICSTLGGVAAILFALDVNSIQPSQHGNFYELYAIAAAVLGGCSLRGGEGAILGILIGTAVMQVLYASINILGIPTDLEFAIIGAALLLGVIADEFLKRYADRRRTAQQARALAEKAAAT